MFHWFSKDKLKFEVMLGFESNWQNVTVDTSKMDILQHGAAATSWQSLASRFTLYSAFAIKIHNNGLPGEGEI